MLFFRKKSTAPAESGSLLQRLRAKLSKTYSFASSLKNLFSRNKVINEELLEEVEEILLSADCGVALTKEIIQQLKKVKVDNAEELYPKIQEIMAEIIKPAAQPLTIQHQPHVILLVGINGAGKTTTVGKLAAKLQKKYPKIMLAAGDTFRAAAVEQLVAWGERLNIPVAKAAPGADSAALIFDAYQSCIAKQYDILLADTAGRLHTKDNLMQELQKIVRVLKKINPDAPHEIILVLDASIGQNALAQVEKFNEALNVNGLIMTKLDGTAKGGILFAITQQYNIPVRFIGVGEQVEDLCEFNAQEFTEAIF